MKYRARILKLIADRSSVSSSEVAEVLGVTRQTAHHHLMSLVRAGDLIRRGQGRATRYVLSPEVSLPEIASWLDDEVQEVEFFGSVGDSLRGRLAGRDDPLAPVAWAIDYMLLERSDERRDHHGPFGPFMETVEGQYPPPLNEVSDAAVSLWEQVSELVTHPRLKARLNDLMWERQWSDQPYLHAVAAIDAYLKLAPPITDGLEYASALSRAVSLARQINNGNRRRLVVKAALRRAGTELADAEPKPRIVLRLLEVAIDDRDDDTRQQVADLLEQAAEVFDDPWIRDDILGLQLAISSRERKRQTELQRQSVDVWIKHASAESGMRRRFFLTRALDNAHTYGFHEVAEQIRSDIQELELGEDEMQSVSVEVDLPRDYIDETLAWISSADGWGTCIQRLMAFGPLSGSLKQNIETVHQNAEEFVFQHLFPTHVFGPWNETIFIATTEEQKAQLGQSRLESLSINMKSYIVAEALDRIQATHGHPIKAELEAFFTTQVINGNTAERMAASVDHFVQGRFDECVMVLIPRIERTIRELLRMIGAPTWSEPRSGRFGMQRPLRQLLAQLEDHMDEDWRRYLITLLVNPLGPNLRNVHMHGLALRGTRDQAAALIHAAVFLTFARLGSGRNASTDNADPDPHTT